jgi:hypothetical protein
VTHPEPTDEDIATALGSAPAELWDQLFATAEALTAEDLAVPPPQPPFGLTAPREYSPRVNTICRLLSEVNAVFPFDWKAWEGRHVYPGGRELAEAPVADAARLATAVIRGERFADGTIAQALADGTLLAIVDRLRAWRATTLRSS